MLLHPNQIEFNDPHLNALLSNVIAESGLGYSIQFGDQEEPEATGYFVDGALAFTRNSDNKSVIFIKNLSELTRRAHTLEEGHSIAHELGHVLLWLRGYPSIKAEVTWVIVEMLNIMQHVLLYQILKKQYEIDLYEVGNQRLNNYLRSDLITFKNDHIMYQNQLVMSVVKYEVEANDSYLKEKLRKAYRPSYMKEYLGSANMLLKGIKDLEVDKSTPAIFIAKFNEVLTVLAVNPHEVLLATRHL